MDGIMIFCLLSSEVCAETEWRHTHTHTHEGMMVESLSVSVEFNARMQL